MRLAIPLLQIWKIEQDANWQAGKFLQRIFKLCACEAVRANLLIVTSLLNVQMIAIIWSCAV